MKPKAMRQECGGGTYSRGFFLGPGLPRGFGGPSAIIEAPLFAPDFGPGMPLFLEPLVGVAELFSSAGGAEVAGTGVAFDSEPTSGPEGSAAGNVASAADELDDAVRDALLCGGCGEGSKRARSFPLRLRMTTLLFFAFFIEFLEEAGAEF